LAVVPAAILFVQRFLGPGNTKTIHVGLAFVFTTWYSDTITSIIPVIVKITFRITTVSFAQVFKGLGIHTFFILSFSFFLAILVVFTHLFFNLSRSVLLVDKSIAFIRKLLS